jgi:hypothetical protein
MEGGLKKVFISSVSMFLIIYGSQEEKSYVRGGSG